MRRSATLMAVLAVAGAVVTGVWTGRWIRSGKSAHASAARSQAGLYIDPDQLHFGEVWETDRFVWRMTIENRGNEACAVESLSGSCACQRFTPQRFTLGPGEKQQIELALDLRNGASHADVEPVREFGVTFWATVRGRNRPSYWSLKGQVRSAFRCPDRIDLGMVSELCVPGPTFRFPLIPLTDLARVEARDGGPLLTAEVGPTGDRCRYELRVTPGSGLAKQKYQTDVELVPVRTAGDTLPSVRVPVAFEVAGDVEAMPDVIHFGAQDVGEAVRDAVTLRSHSGRPFVVRSIRMEGDGLAVRPVDQPGLATYEVMQTAARPDLQSGRVVFVVDLSGLGQLEVEVPVYCSGHARR